LLYYLGTFLPRFSFLSFLFFFFLLCDIEPTVTVVLKQIQ
jgi:hypothetical protein